MLCGIDLDTGVVLLASIALVRSKMRAASSLSPALWIIMSVDAALTATCFLTSNDWSDGGLNFCSQAIATVVIAVLAIRFGKEKFSAEDRTDLASCAFATLCWTFGMVFGFPLVGELALLAIGLIGAIALFRSVVRNPKGEDLLVWTLFLAADLRAVASFEGDSLTGLGFLGLELATSLGVVSLCVACAYLAFFQYRRYKSRARGIALSVEVGIGVIRRPFKLPALHACSPQLLAHALADV